MQGTLHSFGPAPFEFKEANKPSFYLRLKIGKEIKTLWSVGLKDAISASGVEIGQCISVKLTGKTAITLPSGKRANRNSYNITSSTSRAADTSTNASLKSETETETETETKQNYTFDAGYFIAIAFGVFHLWFLFKIFA